MKKATQSLKLFAAEHLTTKNLHIVLVLVTLVTLVLSAGAPVDPGGGTG